MVRSMLHGGRYSYKPSVQHRSGLEDNIARQISLYEKEVYEEQQLQYEVPAIMHTYTPDFILRNGIIIEAKGLFDAADRQKHLYIKQQHPNLDIRFVFQRPSNKIYKGSNTTYAKWCEKHGIKWATRVIPESWFKEEQKDTKGLMPKKKKGGKK